MKTCDCVELTTKLTLTKGVIDSSGGGPTTSFASTDGSSTAIFVAVDPTGTRHVDALFDADVSASTPLTYTLTEVPFSKNPADKMLDLSGASASGTFDPASPKVTMILPPAAEPTSGSYVYVDIKDAGGVVLKRAVLTLAPAAVVAANVKIRTTIDRINKDITSVGGDLDFALSYDARVTITVDGNVISQQTSPGTPPTPMLDVPLPAGRNAVIVTRDMVPVPGDHEFKIVAKFSDQNIIGATIGTVEHEVVITEFLPVGHKFVKGIDLYDGHLTLQREDVSIRGVGPQLQFTRSYGSVGNSSDGPMGAGWSHSYMGRVTRDQLGKITVIGGEGSGSRFFNPVSSIAPSGHTQVTYRPQAGYHGSLIYDVQDDTYEYFTKERTHYHYEYPANQLPSDDRTYRLKFIEDSFGNRSTITYDPQAVYNIKQVQDASGRTLAFTYEPHGEVPEDRIVEVDGPDSIIIKYTYDQYGNLKTATRDNLVEQYEYTVTQLRDRHNLTKMTGPNNGKTGPKSDVTVFAYYTDTDTFPGEVTPFDPSKSILLVPDKFELIKKVTEGFDTPEASFTQFTYDYSQLATKFITIVHDPINTVTTYTMHPRGAVIDEKTATSYGDNITTWKWSFQENPPIDDVYVTEKTDPNGQVTTWAYDNNANVKSETIDYSATGYASVTNGAGLTLPKVVTQYDYDPKFSKLLSKTDSESNVTTYSLDSNTGAILSVTSDPKDGTAPVSMHNTYKSAGGLNGLLDTVTDLRGIGTVYQSYDTWGNPTTIVDGAGNQQINVFDIRSRKRHTTDTFGHDETYDYDTFDRLIKVTKAAGNQPADPSMASNDELTIATYFPGGQRHTSTNGLGYTNTYSYDALNRPTKESGAVVDADGTAVTIESQFSYDGNGNRTLEIDRRGIEHHYDYDELNRLTGIRVEPLAAGNPQQTATYTYDAAGNRMTEKDIHGHTSTLSYDGLYRKVKTALRSRHALTTAYDSLGHVLQTSDANGHATSMTYDGLYRLRSRTDPVGVKTQYNYDANGNRTLETNLTSGLVVQYGPYDALNRPTTIAQQFKDPLTGANVVLTTVNSYDDAAHLRTVLDPRGSTVEEHFNGADRLIERTTDAAGLHLTTTYKYDGDGNVAAMKDPEGPGPDVVSAFDGLNRRIRTDVLLGGTEKLYYDSNGNIVKTVDMRGIVTRHDYDHLDRNTDDIVLQSITAAAIRLYPHRLRRCRERNHDRRRQHSCNDPLFRRLHHVVREVDALGQQSYSEWDGVNKRADVDKKGNRTEFDFDDANRLRESRDLDGGQVKTRITTTYNDSQNQRIDTDRNGVQTIAQMDAIGRVRRLSRKHPGLAAGYGTTEFVAEEKKFDGNGNTVEIIDANGNSTQFTFDGAGRRTEIIEGVGSPVQAKTTYTYDGVGSVQTVKNGRSTGSLFDARYTYDDRHRKITQENGLGEITHSGYDQSNNLSAVTQAKGGQYTTLYAYDELGKLLSVDERRGGAGGVTTYTYDGVRNRLSQRDASGNLMTFQYDDLNRLTDTFAHTSSSPDLGTARHWHYGYDPNDNQTLIVDPLGQHVDKSYDHLNRVTSKTYSNHATANGAVTLPKLISTTYQYDANGNNTGITEVKSFDGQVLTSENTTLVYDPLNRQTQRTNADQKTVQTTYDRMGNQIGIIDADSVKTTQLYDTRNRLGRVTTEIGGTTPSGDTTYEYWPDNLLKQTTFPNATSEQRTYDAADRLTGIVNADGSVAVPVSTFAYTYDANGNPITQTEQHRQLNSAAGQTQYAYDALNRLTTATYPGGSAVTYTYAANGNRLTEVGTNPTTQAPINRTYAYDRLNELTRITDGANPTASVLYAYDLNGNTIQQTAGQLDPNGQIPNPVSLRRFNYDIRDQLAEIDQAGGTGGVFFDYDFTGRRTKLRTPLFDIRFLYDSRNVVQEYDANSKLTTLKYNYNLTQPLSMVLVNGGQRNSLFYMYDGRLSPSELVDATGGIRASYAYDAWGGMRFSFDLTPNRRKFAGGYFDPESGYHLFGARFYDDSIGRFTSRDPFAGVTSDPGTLHPYMYAADNPMVYVDQDGHFIHIIAGAAIGAVGGCIIGAITDTGCAKGALVGAVVGGLGAATFGVSMAATGSLGFGAFVGGEALGGGVIAGTWAGSALISATVTGIVAGGAGGFLTTMSKDANSFGEFFSKKNWSEHADEAIANGFAGAFGGGIAGAAGGILAEAVLVPSGVSAIKSDFLSNAIADVLSQGAQVKAWNGGRHQRDLRRRGRCVPDRAVAAAASACVVQGHKAAIRGAFPG